MTRLGDFLKFLSADILTKVAQIFNNFLGYFENIILKVKTIESTFWATFVENWVTLIPTSGHTDLRSPKFTKNVSRKKSVLEEKKIKFRATRKSNQPQRRRISAKSCAW